MESVLQCPELLTEILSKLLLAKPVVSSFYRTSAHFSLTQVCTSWRELIVETAMFWTSIQFYCNKRDPELRLRYDLLAKMWLERSKGLPFSLTLLETSKKKGIRPSHMPTQVLQHANHLHHLHLNMTTLSLYQLLSLHGHYKTTFSSLKSISVTHSKRMRHDIAEEAPTFEFQQFTGSLPSVTTVRMMVGEMILGWMQLCNPSRLTILDLVPDPYTFDFPLPVEKTLSVLRQCPSLQEARLLCIGGDSSLINNLVITHKSLCTLALYEPSQGQPTIGHILANLTTPRLISLSITSMMEDLTLDTWRSDPFSCPWSMSRMMDFVSRLSNPLQELRLRFPSKELNASVVSDILLHNPCLRTFHFSLKYKAFAEVKGQKILATIKREERVPITPKSLFYRYNPNREELTFSSERRWWFESGKLMGGILYRS